MGGRWRGRDGRVDPGDTDGRCDAASTEVDKERRSTVVERLMCGGAPGMIRTCDTRFRKPVLYPLSYEGVLATVRWYQMPPCVLSGECGCVAYASKGRYGG